MQVMLFLIRLKMFLENWKGITEPYVQTEQLTTESDTLDQILASFLIICPGKALCACDKWNCR